MTTFEFPKTNKIGCRFPQVNGRNGALQVSNHTKEYFYELLPGMEMPRVGDLVVVSCVNGFQVAQVTTLNALYEGPDMALVVGVVDPSAYVQYLERKEKKAAVYAQMMAMKKQLEKEYALELFAEKSSEFKELLEMYKSL